MLAAPGPAAAQQSSPGRRRSADKLSPPAAQEGLSADLFYKLLLGDVALQRGDTALAARAYFEAARESRDPRVARRATEIALATRQRGLAQESAKLWASLDPDAERPKQIMASLAGTSAGKDMAEAGVDDEIRVRLEKLLSDAAVSGQGIGEVFLQINRFLAQAARTQAGLRPRAFARQAVSDQPGGAFRRRLAAFTAEMPAGDGIDRHCRRSTSRSN